MDNYLEWFIMVIAGGLLAIWLYRAFYRWLHEPINVNRVKLGKGGAIASNDENVALLKRRGYEVTSGKHVIPIPVLLDETPLGKGARLYIDYIAEKNGLAYIVKTARERMPIDWTASGVRDKLLVYTLLLPDTAGILYVDAKEDTVRKITFDLDEQQ